MAGTAPDSGNPKRVASLPVAPPVSVDSMVRRRPVQAGWLVGGIAIAAAAQVVAGSPWFLTVDGFIRYRAAPDSLAITLCVTAVLQVFSFAACVGVGLGLMRRNRSVGVGLVIGWAGGCVALLIAFALAMIV